jgi:hypothetical protein
MDYRLVRDTLLEKLDIRNDCFIRKVRAEAALFLAFFLKRLALG